jgi:hypothetical protein
VHWPDQTVSAARILEESAGLQVCLQALPVFAGLCRKMQEQNHGLTGFAPQISRIWIADDADWIADFTD